MSKQAKRNDQYGQPIPEDLVTLPDITELSGTEIRWIDGMDWYETKGILMASAKDINYLSEVDPLDAGVDLSDPDVEVLKVDSVLHRWSNENGFYHA